MNDEKEPIAASEQNRIEVELSKAFFAMPSLNLWRSATVPTVSSPSIRPRNNTDGSSERIVQRDVRH